MDEISMVSAELLGTLESVVREAVRVNGTYKKRPDGSTRPFGGVNLIMCGGFWQLQPVGGTFLADNPLGACGLAEQAMLLFWDQSPNSIRNFWDLTKVMRCKDPWYNAFLSSCRDGRVGLTHIAFYMDYQLSHPLAPLVLVTMM